MDENQFLTQITGFYQSALNWATPTAYGATGNVNTAINTGTPFDTGAAQATLQHGDWFQSMQGSFNSNYAFLNSNFQRQQAFLAPYATKITDASIMLGESYAASLERLSKRAAKRGLMSKIFG